MKAVPLAQRAEPYGLVHGRHHRRHYPHLGTGVCRGGRDRLQLVGKHPLVVEGDPEPAHAEGGVGLAVHTEEGQRFVGTGIQGAHDHATGQRLEHLAVGPVLLFDARGTRAVEE